MNREQIGLCFSRDEYKKRLKKLQKSMIKKNIDILLIREPVNIFYICGFNSWGMLQEHTILFVQSQGEPFLLVRKLEKEVVYLTSWLKNENIFTWDDHENPLQKTKELIIDMGWFEKNIAFEKSTKFLSISNFEKLENMLNKKFLDGSWLVENLRKIKSEDEISCIKKAANYTAIGMKQGLESISPGKTENEIAASIYKAMIEAGSEFPSLQPTVTSGWKSGIPRTTFHRRKLKNGDCLLIEVGAVFNRYTAALMRGALIGKEDREMNLIHNVCIDALEAAISTIKPGITSGKVHDSVQEIVDKAGFHDEFYNKRTGYSIGCSYPPEWYEGFIIELKKDDQAVLEPGMVFHIPPALRILKRCGTGVSETVLVTNNGCEILTDFPRNLYIIN